jgi:hypothetical protein
MNYFVVFQNQTFREEHSQGILWAPKSDKNGGPAKFHWSSMQDIKKGDVIFSIIKNVIVSRGVALGKAVDEPNPFSNDLWNREGWLVKVEYNYTYERVRIMDHIETIRPLLPRVYSPFNQITGRGNQGYLYPISKDLGVLLDSFINDIYQSENFIDFFDIDQETSDTIRHLFEEQNIDEGTVIIVETDKPEQSNRPKIKKQVIHGRKIDFIKKAEQDSKTGMLAEKLVVEHEKDYLIANGREDLAQSVKWVAKEADGYGYDVLSYDLDGNEKYIEVKATLLGKNHPFEITANEVMTSDRLENNYWIYRVYYMNSDQPMFYKIHGSVKIKLDLEPTVYRAFIKDKKDN